jgi:hypothetical protein
MITISRNFASVSQIIGSGDGWVTLSGTTESFSSDVALYSSGYEGVHLVVEMDYASSPTDNVNISIYGSLDGVNYDDTPLWTVQGDKTVDPQQLSFIVRDLAHFIVGVKQTGSTNSHKVRAYVKPWNWKAE